jgi:hypothetical protein
VLMHAPVFEVAGEVYNVASCIDRGMGDIATEIVEKMGGDLKLIVNIGDRPGQVARHTGDGNKTAKQFGWKPSVDWGTGLARTIDWFRDNVGKSRSGCVKFPSRRLGNWYEMNSASVELATNTQIGKFDSRDQLYCGMTQVRRHQSGIAVC